MRRRFALVAAAVVVAAAATSYVARAQDKKGPGIIRVELNSIFQAHPGVTTRLVRGMLVMPDGDVKSQDFRIPIHLPVGATITEVGCVGQTSNQMLIKVERLDHTQVYEGKELQANPTGSWTCMSVVDHSMARRVEKPVSDDEKAPELPRRFKWEDELLVVATLARDPNLGVDTRRAPPASQKDRIEAIWVKYESQ
jgi:hypothetical protein